MHRRDFLRLSSAAVACATACPIFFGQISKTLSELSAADGNSPFAFKQSALGR